MTMHRHRLRVRQRAIQRRAWLHGGWHLAGFHHPQDHEAFTMEWNAEEDAPESTLRLAHESTYHDWTVTLSDVSTDAPTGVLEIEFHDGRGIKPTVSGIGIIQFADLGLPALRDLITALSFVADGMQHALNTNTTHPARGRLN